jgi:hypothetical protein
MFAMFKQLFAAITSYFVALEKTANAAVHLSTWAEESAGAFADEARVQRQQKLNLMLKETRVTEKQLSAVTK